MTDRDALFPAPDAPLDADESELSIDEQLTADSTSDEPFPQGPNDEGFGASPPVEASQPRISDDDDLDSEGSGLRNTPIRGAYESAARRSDLARRLEELLVDVEEWAHEDGSDRAQWILDTLGDAYEQLGLPPEDTIDEPEEPPEPRAPR
ncbi:hypothetical protein BH23DEI1_BH23DEI1_06080 [soil metagenome]